MVKLEYLGHSAFMIHGTRSVLIDPFLTGNPMASRAAEEVDPDLILVTHAHDDHLGDAVAISRRTGSPILSTNEVADHCEAEGAEVIHAHIGGEIAFPFGRVKLYPAIHGSSLNGVTIGIACSFALEMDGRCFYHAGDTALFSDMAYVAEDFDLDAALLPIGGRFTMHVADAVKAVRLLDPVRVIPMHYDTFEGIEADPEEFKRLVEGSMIKEVVVLPPGSSYEVD